MTAKAAMSGAVLYGAESSWAENTDTFGVRLRVLNEPDMTGLKRSKIPVPIMKQYYQEGVQFVDGGYSGSFTLELPLTGRGSTSAGAVSLCALSTLLSYCGLNAAVASSTGTTVSGGSSTATSVDVAAATGFSAGSLCRVGALGDGDGEGQFAAVSAHAASAIALLTALDGAPAAAAVVYAPDIILSLIHI